MPITDHIHSFFVLTMRKGAGGVGGVRPGSGRKRNKASSRLGTKRPNKSENAVEAHSQATQTITAPNTARTASRKDTGVVNTASRKDTGVVNVDIESDDEAAPPKIPEEVEVELATVQEYENDYQSSVIEHRERVQRKCVAFVFENSFGAIPVRSEWIGKGGIISQIRQRLGIPLNTKLEQILEDVVECKRTGEFYSGERKVKAELGRVPLIDLKSIEAQIIADAMEAGFKDQQALCLINQHCKENGTDAYTLTLIKTC
jgi:hypothetical protein